MKAALAAGFATGACGANDIDALNRLQAHDTYSRVLHVAGMYLRVGTC